MNEEQHYTITEVIVGEPPLVRKDYLITIDDGYYITPDDIRVFNSDFEPTHPNLFYLFRLDDGNYMLSNSDNATHIELGDISDIHVTTHKKENGIYLPDIVKQKIKNEEYTIDVTCDIDEIGIHIDGTNYLQSCSLDVDRFIKGQGVIGGFVANEFELKLIDFPNSDIVGCHLNISAIINYQDSGTNHSHEVPIGNYIISTSAYDDTSGVYTIKAYDNALLYNVDYVPKIQFPCTAIELVNDVVNQTEQKLADTTDAYVGILPSASKVPWNTINYYFTINGVNYGFTRYIGSAEDSDPYNMVNDTGFVFNGEDVLIKIYFPNVYSDAQNVRTGSAGMIYESIKVVELQDTTGYLYVDVHPVKYKSFNNNLFVIPSNPFDVMTQTNQNDQSVTVTHASCRKVIQDVAKLLYGWAYINNNGELDFDTLKNTLTTNIDNFIIDGKVVIHEPPNQNEIISPHNVARTEYLTWVQVTVSTNYMCLYTNQVYTLWDDDGLEIRRHDSDIKINRPTGETSVTTTNDERVTRFQDLDYKISNPMFIRWEIEGFQHIPYIKYIRNNEEIESTDTTILLEPGDNIIAIGYVLNAHTYVDDDCTLYPYFSTMDNYGHPYEVWKGELLERYGILSYIDEEYRDGLTYVFDKNDQNYGKEVLHLGTHTISSHQCTWQYDAQEELFYAELPTEYEPYMWLDESFPIKAVDGTVLWCSHYQAKIPDSNDDYAIFIDNNVLYIRDRDHTSLEDWTIWSGNIQFEVSYGLESPLNIVINDIFTEIVMTTIEQSWKPVMSLSTFDSIGSEYKELNRTLNIDRTYNYIDTNHYIKSKQIGEPTEPIASVLLGLKDIEGENVCYKITTYDKLQTPWIDLWDALKDIYYESGNYPCVEIYDNDITFTPELRELALIGGGDCLFGISYTPLEIEMPGMPWLINCAPYIFENVDGTVVIGYAFKSHFEYKGYIKQKISSESNTIIENDYAYNGSQTSALNQTRYIVDKQNQQITSLVQRVEDNTSELSRIQQDVRSWTAEFESVGGGNYIKNSVGLGDITNIVWGFTEDSQTSSYTYGTTSDASLYTKSGSRWYLDGYKMTQSINVLQNSTYSFACKIKKPIDTMESCYIKIYDTTNPTNAWEIIPDPAKEYNFEELRLSGDNAVQPQTTNITVEVYASEGCQLTISDMMLNAGNMCSTWTPAAGEILTTNVKMDAGGLRVLSTDYVNTGLGDYTIMTPSYFRGYGNNNGTEECVFQVSGTKTMIYDAQVKNSQVYGDADSSHYNVKVIPVTNSNYDGIAFIKSHGE